MMKQSHRGSRTAILAIGLSSLAVATGGITGAGPIRAHAATPGMNTLNLPNSGTAGVTWNGTVGAGAGNAANLVSLRCNPPGVPGHPVDNFVLTVSIPGGSATFYKTHLAVLTVRIDWQPVTSAAVNDLGLTTSYPSGGTLTDFQDSHQVATTFEQVTIVNPKDGGAYNVGACPDTNIQDQPYMGSAVARVSDLTSGGGVTFDASTSVSYAPATIVSPTFLGAEPQTTLERTLPTALSGATDNNRIFVDWPLSTRTQIGQLYRSTDGSDSFRLLFDLSCAVRSRPNCLTGGGGDTVDRVNLYDGTVLYGDQEAVVNEALASSTDHGDTFPTSRQFAVTNADTGVDRQWLSPVNAPGVTGGTALSPGTGPSLEGFYSYHIPAAGEFIQGISTTDGAPIPQPAPQLALVSQSGPSRVDVIPGSHGNGYIYQSYRDGSGFEVGVAPISQYISPTAWKVQHVSNDQPAIFPWINLDNQGNLYAVWVSGGNLFYSYSLINDPANDPTATPAGSPGTKWAPEAKINPPNITSTVFPEVTAGDQGRIAVVYYGTTDYAGQSDGAPDGTRWNVYTELITNATDPAGISVATGQVNHRVAHLGSICTSGTTCTGDRSLLDLCDVGFDSDGRVGVVFMDNQSAFGGRTGTKQSPFVHFAKEVQGPSLLSGSPAVNVFVPNGPRTDPVGDATWPNVAGAQNIPGLDEVSADIGTDGTGTNIVGSIQLNKGSIADMKAALAQYNAANGAAGLGNSAQRLQYLLRFSTATDVYYLSMDVDANGVTRFFGGKLDPSDSVTNGTSTLGAAYRTKPGTTVTGSIDPATNTINFSTAANTADFAGVGSGTQLFSVVGYSLAGPAEGMDQTILDTMRTVDATPPYDTVLQTPASVVAESPWLPLLLMIAAGSAAAVGIRSRRRRGRAQVGADT